MVQISFVQLIRFNSASAGVGRKRPRPFCQHSKMSKSGSWTCAKGGGIGRTGSETGEAMTLHSRCLENRVFVHAQVSKGPGEECMICTIEG